MKPNIRPNFEDAMSLTQYETLPECAALNKQIREAYDALDEFVVKHKVRERTLPAILLCRYDALIRQFDTVVAKRDVIVKEKRRASNELLCKRYQLEIGQRYYYPEWKCTGLVAINEEGYIMFVADDMDIWPITLRTDNITKLERTDEVSVRTLTPILTDSPVAITDKRALERARSHATGRLP
jgi:hypothetical protein